MIPENNADHACYDLHCHTTASDGVLDVQPLLQRAVEQGVDVLAITDHDTVAAHQLDFVLPAGLGLLSGVEFSCRWRKRGVHIVGLGMDIQHEDFVAGLEAQASRRTERALVIADKLGKLGFKGLEVLLEDVPAARLGRPLFARLMVEKGWVKNESMAFKKYLGAGKPGDVSLMWPEMTEVIGWIKSAGGIAVLAHPMQYRLTLSKLRELLLEFVNCGGQAMEVSSGQMQAADLQAMANMAQKFGLYASTGSDFHGPNMPWRELGHASPLPKICKPVWMAPELQESN